MSELIAIYPYRFPDSEGRECYARLLGEEQPNGEWEAALEFVLCEGQDDPILTRPIMTAPNRMALRRRAEALREPEIVRAFEGVLFGRRLHDEGLAGEALQWFKRERPSRDRAVASVAILTTKIRDMLNSGVTDIRLLQSCDGTISADSVDPLGGCR